MLLLAAVVSIVVIAIVLVPFFYGEGGRLLSGSANHTPKELRSIMKAIVQMALNDEKALERKEISSKECLARKTYLLRRYVDTARRLDFQSKEGQSGVTQ